MILPTYFKQARSILFSAVLVAAPCAAHKVGHKHSTATHSNNTSISLSKLSHRATQQYLQTGNDDILDAFEKQLNQHTDVSNQHYLAQAWLAQARHQFTHSLNLLGQVLEREPTNGQAWLTQASVLQVQGQVSQAKQACNEVLQHLSLEAGLLCKARLALSAEEKRSALTVIQSLLQHALSEQNAPKELRSWAYAIAAELASELNLGAQAEKYFNASLNLFSAIQVRASYMDFLIGQRRYEQALKISDNSTNPALYIRELIARKHLEPKNRGVLNRAIQNTHRQFTHWQSNKDYQHAREMAMFYLDVMEKPTLALTLAEINLQNQQEPEDHALLRRAQKIKN